uniref:Uncharacterized protein n=1 Tax=Anopheles minimus TaxID=112268 RepID=A0A182WNB6_9DIPT
MVRTSRNWWFGRNKASRIAPYKMNSLMIEMIEEVKRTFRSALSLHAVQIKTDVGHPSLKQQVRGID